MFTRNYEFPTLETVLEQFLKKNQLPAPQSVLKEEEIGCVDGTPWNSFWMVYCQNDQMKYHFLLHLKGQDSTNILRNGKMREYGNRIYGLDGKINSVGVQLQASIFYECPVRYENFNGGRGKRGALLSDGRPTVTRNRIDTESYWFIRPANK